MVSFDDSAKDKGVSFDVNACNARMDSDLCQEECSDVFNANEFHAKFGSTDSNPVIEKDFSYDVVGRLSRWEGGRINNPYQNTKQNNAQSDERIFLVAQEDISLGEFCRQFFKPSYDLTEVTVEDIDRTKLMHDRFLNSSQFDFNYTTLLVIAATIAALGLANESSASVIASMLVSPLMGPVTSVAYGLSIGDFKMVRMGLVTEIVSLIVCVVVGALFAAVMLPFDISDKWPTDEMKSRGTIQNFLVGIPIAFFSGLGVAVGLLDSQTNSLVGVAISASLLPPAVNCGMFYVIEWSYLGDSGNYFKMGNISMGLTLVNILFIIIASMLMFRLKETLPIEKSIFWTDLGIARKIYHNVALFPVVQQAPDDVEIKKRVTKFFPRASAMILQTDFRPETSNSSDITSGGPMNVSSNNSSLKSSFKYQWSNTSSKSVHFPTD